MLKTKEEMKLPIFVFALNSQIQWLCEIKSYVFLHSGG